jgi:hypothetical protein
VRLYATRHGEPFEDLQAPFRARVGSITVERLGHRDRSLSGWLAEVPKPGDRLFVGHETPDPTCLVY